MRIKGNGLSPKKAVIEFNMIEIKHILKGLLLMDKNDQVANLRRFLNHVLVGKDWNKKVGHKHRSKKITNCPHCRRKTRGWEALLMHVAELHPEAELEAVTKKNEGELYLEKIEEFYKNNTEHLSACDFRHGMDYMRAGVINVLMGPRFVNRK